MLIARVSYALVQLASPRFAIVQQIMPTPRAVLISRYLKYCMLTVVKCSLTFYCLHFYTKQVLNFKHQFHDKKLNGSVKLMEWKLAASPAQRAVFDTIKSSVNVPCHGSRFDSIIVVLLLK